MPVCLPATEGTAGRQMPPTPVVAAKIDRDTPCPLTPTPPHAAPGRFLDEQWPKIRNMGRQIARRYLQARGRDHSPAWEGHAYFEDVDQETYIAAADAMRTYDTRRGSRPETWAYYAIVRHFSRVLRDDGRTETLTIEVPFPEASALATELGLDERSCLETLRLDKRGLGCLNQTLAALGHQVWIERRDIRFQRHDRGLVLKVRGRRFFRTESVEPREIQAIAAPFDNDRPENNLPEAALQTYLGVLLTHLSAVQRQVIAQRFGLNGTAQGYRDIATDLGVSSQRVQQIEKGVLETLRDQILADLAGGQGAVVPI